MDFAAEKPRSTSNDGRQGAGGLERRSLDVTINEFVAAVATLRVFHHQLWAPRGDVATGKRVVNVVQQIEQGTA